MLALAIKLCFSWSFWCAEDCWGFALFRLFWRGTSRAKWLNWSRPASLRCSSQLVQITLSLCQTPLAQLALTKWNCLTAMTNDVYCVYACVCMWLRIWSHNSEKEPLSWMVKTLVRTWMELSRKVANSVFCHCCNLILSCAHWHTTNKL